MTDPVLRADSIGKAFRGTTMLSAATLRAVPGSVTLLLGRNGIGKTTLLRIAAGRLAPDYGTVSFNGRAYLRAHGPVLARAGLFFLVDRGLLSPLIRVRDHLAAMARQFRTGGIDAAVDGTGIAPLLGRCPATLSPGEVRRVELACALVRRPMCLLADEPYRHVDPGDRAVVSRVLRALASQGCAVVITAHEMADASAVADQVTWCTSGTTYELGPTGTALRHERLVREYLGPGALPLPE